MQATLIKVAEILNDNQYHDGNSIGKQLNITRAAVWKIIKKLEAYNIPIQSVKGKGYILEEPLILLDENKIKALISEKNIDIEVHEKIDSTNDYLKKSSKKNKKIRVCIAESQTQGKGRLNRQWHSPFGKNIYFSMNYPFQKDMSELSGLSLVVGLAVCSAIENSCSLSHALQVKWPNDILANQKKISGNLIEIQAESHGFCQAIIGIGINVNMQHAYHNEINQQWASVRELSQSYQDRNQLCVQLIQQLLSYLQRFCQSGLKVFLNEWQQRDYLFNKAIKLTSHQTVFSVSFNCELNLQDITKAANLQCWRNPKCMRASRKNAILKTFLFLSLLSMSIIFLPMLSWSSA